MLLTLDSKNWSRKGFKSRTQAWRAILHVLLLIIHVLILIIYLDNIPQKQNRNQNQKENIENQNLYD